jgi:hypothetical protein
MNNPIPPLDTMPLNDATWASIKRELEQKLANERNKLEAPGSDIDATNVSRGRISVLKELLELPRVREMLAKGIAVPA